MKMKRMIKTAAAALLFFTGILSQAQTWGDYTFYSQMNSTKAYLINMAGTAYHSWTFASNKQTGYSSYLLPGGVVLRTVAHAGNSFSGGGMTGEVMKADWNGNVLWDFVYSTSTYCMHHDVCAMPNGNVLIIAYESKTAAEVTAAGCSQSIVMWPEKIVEVQPNGATGGTIVWEWHVWDHLCQTYNAAKANYVTSIVQHPELLNINYNTQKDWMHANGIDYNPALDQITFSSHMLNEIYVIDHSTTTAEAASHSGGNSGKGGDFLYRWGNPAAYQAAGTTDFNVVHDAHWVPADCPRANYLAGFNNKGGTGGKTCVDLFNPPYNGYNYNITLGSAYAPATYNWRHTYTGSPTQDLGNSQQLPNGNTLVCIAQSGYVYEIDSNQTMVWSKSIGGTVPHAYRYTACYVNGTTTVTASATPAQVCPGAAVQLNAIPASGSGYTYSWTSVPAGFTSSLQNPVVNPTVSTSYIVTITNGTCTSSDTTDVSVAALTVAASASPQQICPGGTSQLNAVPGIAGSYSYEWSSDPAGFSSTQPNPLVSPSVQTVYSVTVTGGTCTATNTVTVGILTQPVVTASAAPSLICPNASSQLDAATIPLGTYSYSWTSIPAGFTSNVANPMVGPAATTLYIVNIAANGCTDADSVTVTVEDVPATPVITQAGDSLMSSASTGNQWYKDGVILTGETGQYLVPTGPGSYVVKVTSQLGCYTVPSDPFVWVGIGGADGCRITIYPNPTSGQLTIRTTWAEGISYRVSLFNTLGQQVLTIRNRNILDLSSLNQGIYYLSVVTERNESYTAKVIVTR